MSAPLLADDVMRADTIDLTGRKYGHLTVLGMAGRKAFSRRPDGVIPRFIYWRVRCDCGAEFHALGGHIRGSRYRAGVNRCRDCAAAKCRDFGKERLSVRLPSGRTIAQIADAAGLDIDTVYARWRRGWPESDLGLPLRPRKKHTGTSQRIRPAVTLTNQ